MGMWETNGWEVRGSASSPNGSGIPTCPARRPHHFQLEDRGSFEGTPESCLTYQPLEIRRYMLHHIIINDNILQ